MLYTLYELRVEYSRFKKMLPQNLGSKYLSKSHSLIKVFWGVFMTMSNIYVKSSIAKTVNG